MNREHLRKLYDIIPKESNILEEAFKKYGPLYKLKDGAAGYLGIEIPEEQFLEVFKFVGDRIIAYYEDKIEKTYQIGKTMGIPDA